MPRSREYDRDSALDGTVGLFQESGYKAAPIQDLVAATEANRAWTARPDFSPSAA